MLLRHRVIPGLVLLLLVLALLVPACSSVNSDFEEETVTKEGSITVNSRTILEEIAQNGESAFRSLSATPNPGTMTQQAAVEWGQFEYFELAPALFKFVWNEPMERTYNPNLRKQWAIDPDQVKVTAEKALEIAEQNGGSQVRADFGNACVISVGLFPGSRYAGWQVSYSEIGRQGISSRFVLQVDPLSGQYQLENSGR